MANPNDPVDAAQKKKEAAALRKVKMLSLTATPSSITPFGQSNVAWRVTVPASTDPDVVISIALDNDDVQPTGNKLVSPTFSHTFKLRAKGELAEIVLGTTTVTVNAAACDVHDSVVASSLRGQLANMLTGGSQITPRGNGVEVTFGDFSINIFIPLSISIPNWFDATMDVTMKFTLFETFGPFFPLGKVQCGLSDVSVDVSWGLLSHVLSFGCTGIVQAALEIEAKAFLEMIGSQLAIQAANAFEVEQQQRISFLNANDPQHRHFKQHSMRVSAAGVSFVSCPI